MIISDRQKAFLQVYKGNITEKVIRELHPEWNKNSLSINTILISNLKYSNINRFLRFLKNPNDDILKEVNLYRLDEMLEMIQSIEIASCEYSLAHPISNRALYRFENMSNMREYDEGEIDYIKSTSKSHSEATVFNDPNTVKLAFKAEGFVPYVSIDEVISGGKFIEEKEIIFPPFLNVELTDEYDENYSGRFQIVKVSNGSCDSFPDIGRFHEAEDKLESVFLRDKNEGKVSDELKSLCHDVHDYLRKDALKLYETSQMFFDFSKEQEDEDKKAY